MGISSITAGDREYEVRTLTRSLARDKADELLRIHNIIPHVHWDTADLLADTSPKGEHYADKWKLSFVVLDGDKAVGLLVAYARKPSSKHPVESIYVHRLAVDPEYQGSGIGSRFLRAALDYYYRELPQVMTYTVQTNDEASNGNVIRFYEAAGFQRYMPVRYPEKLDVLLKMKKSDLR
jgi:ribosomal protein S18 acetylase RimI-like enzyme